MQLLLRRLTGEAGVRSKVVRLKPEISYRDSCGCVGAA